MSIPCLPLVSSWIVNAGKILQLSEPSTSRPTLRINVFMFCLECLGNKVSGPGGNISLYDRTHQKCNEISTVSLLSGCILFVYGMLLMFSESRSLSLVSHTAADDYSQ